MPATLKDIAKLTGLSVPSVCLILRGHGHKFRTESRQAVEEAARKLKYRPDMVMRRMGRAGARRDAIGFIMPEAIDPAPGSVEHLIDDSAQEYLIGVNERLLVHDQILVVAKPILNQGAANKPPRILLERFVDGIIIVESGLSESLKQHIADYELITVWLNTERHSDVDCVYPDEKYSGRVAAEHLQQLGHERIAFLIAQPATPLSGLTRPHAAQDRQSGYCEAMARVNRAPNIVDFTSDEQLRTWLRHLRDTRSSKDGPTGIVVGTFILAVRLIELMTQLGLRCPDDLSVIAASEVRVFRTVWPDMTYVTYDRREIAGWAVEMVLQKVTEEGKPQASRVYRGAVVEGKTTARLT
ncbi:MAG: LacI family DNA-binding transcriptional regulator [Phycisphaeraceae bacterium]|nr:LacI family DNA-binding transcriptional regulator [Phycisphaeraceae bacterium]